MKVEYDPDFIKKFKKLDVRIKRAFEKRLAVFIKNPFDLELNNHQLSEEYSGLRSIDVTSNYRAIYEEILKDGSKQIASFVLIGTHDELYSKTPKEEHDS